MVGISGRSAWESFFMALGSAYATAMLPEERKARVRETQFPQDLQKAYELGKRLATEAKQG